MKLELKIINKRSVNKRAFFNFTKCTYFFN